MDKKSTELSIKLDMSDILSELPDLIRTIEDVEKERDEAVAHIERMKEEWEKNDAAEVSTGEKLELLVDLLYGEPSKSLEKRDLNKQAEAIELAAAVIAGGMWTGEKSVKYLKEASEELRQQAKEISKK